MAIIGLLILLVVAAVVVAVLLTGDGPATVGFDWFEIDTAVTGVFLTGVGSVLFAALGLWLLKVGLRRSSQRRAEMKELRKKAEAAEKQRRIRESGSSKTQRSAVAPAQSATPTTSSTDSAQRQRSSSTPQSTPSMTRPSAPAPPNRTADGPDEYFDTAPRER